MKTKRAGSASECTARNTQDFSNSGSSPQKHIVLPRCLVEGQVRCMVRVAVYGGVHVRSGQRGRWDAGHWGVLYMRDTYITSDHTLVLDRRQDGRWGIISRETLLCYHGLGVVAMKEVALRGHITVCKSRVIGHRLDGVVGGSVVPVILIRGVVGCGRARVRVWGDGVHRVGGGRTDRVVVVRVGLWVGEV